MEGTIQILASQWGGDRWVGAATHVDFAPPDLRDFLLVDAANCRNFRIRVCREMP